MLKLSLRFTFLAAMVFAAASFSRAQSAQPQQWVGTWAASPMQADGTNIRLLIRRHPARDRPHLRRAVRRFAFASPTSLASIRSPSATLM